MSDAWTAADVPDQTGRTVVVTGANSGIGFHVARVFAARGATVVLACRGVDRGEAAADRIREAAPEATLDVRELDLADLESVAAFADAFSADYDALHALCNNAGIMAVPREETADGFEKQFGVNHLGHFALTGHLLDTLAATDGESRVVTQSSGLHERGTIDFADLHREDGYDRWDAYAQSKLANVLFGFELDRRLDAHDVDGVTSVVSHPGYADTDLQFRGPRRSGSTVRLLAMRVLNALLAQPPDRGALPMLYAATAPTVSGGEYVGPGGLVNMRGYPTVQRSSDLSYDRDLAARLWDVSESLTGVAYDFDGLRVAADD